MVMHETETTEGRADNHQRAMAAPLLQFEKRPPFWPDPEALWMKYDIIKKPFAIASFLTILIRNVHWRHFQCPKHGRLFRSHLTS